MISRGLKGGMPFFFKKKDADYYFGKGQKMFEQGDFDRSVRAFSKAIELGMNIPQVYLGRGRSWEEKGDFEEAKKDYEQAKAGGLAPAGRAVREIDRKIKAKKSLYAEDVLAFQEEAAEASMSVAASVEGADYKEIARSLQILKRTEAVKLNDPMVVFRNLVNALGTKGSDSLDIHIKLEIARMA